MNVIKRYEDIRFLKGYNRSTACDLGRSNYQFIPNDLIIFLDSIEGKDFNSLCFPRKEFSKDLADDYYNFLVKNDFIFHIDKDLYPFFPPISLYWDYPSLITNIIIDVAQETILTNSIVNLIEQLGCKHICINLLSTDSTNTDFLSLFDNTIIQSIDIFCNNTKRILSTLKKYPRIKNFYVSSNENKVIRSESGFGNVIYYKENDSFNSKSFEYDIKFFSESQEHHTYFNRKLYIGSDGEVKNAPECDEEFGYIQKIQDVTDIKGVIETPKFQKYWFIHKDLIDVCKDCEFRHMCLDNRLLYQREDESWYHKEECNYNPYISKWKGEEDLKFRRVWCYYK